MGQSSGGMAHLVRCNLCRVLMSVTAAAGSCCGRLHPGRQAGEPAAGCTCDSRRVAKNTGSGAAGARQVLLAACCSGLAGWRSLELQGMAQPIRRAAQSLSGCFVPRLLLAAAGSCCGLLLSGGQAGGEPAACALPTAGVRPHRASTGGQVAAHPGLLQPGEGSSVARGQELPQASTARSASACPRSLHLFSLYGSAAACMLSLMRPTSCHTVGLHTSLLVPSVPETWHLSWTSTRSHCFVQLELTEACVQWSWVGLDLWRRQ